MRIKYTGLSQSIIVKESALGIDYFFQRNIWKDIPVEHAEYLLKSWYFLTEENFNFSNIPDNTRRIALCRFGALGDLIQLIPIVRELQMTYPGNLWYLICNQEYVDFMKQTQVFEDVMEAAYYEKGNFDRRYCLDGILEEDHNPAAPEKEMHRIKIYQKFFNLSGTEYNFDIHIPEEDKIYIEGILNAPV